MVSSGTVSNDLSTFNSSLSSFSTSVQGLSGSWNGPSHENFVSQVDSFINEYKSAIANQLSAFSSACASYAQYKEVKTNLANAQAAYATAQQNEDTQAMSLYSGQISQYQAELNRLKSEIESLLAQASSPSLSASTLSATELSSSGVSNSAVIDSAISNALAIANDDTHGYSQKTRWGNPNYDCSSFVITAWENAGIPVKENGAGYTGNMISGFTKTGKFVWIPGNPKVEDLLPGDVLLNPKVHTEMYIGDGKMIGAHGDRDGVNGDSSGKEINVVKYSGGWEGILRYVGDSETTSV